MVIEIHLSGQANLAEIAHVLGGSGAFLGACVNGVGQGRENANDQNNDKELDQAKAAGEIFLHLSIPESISFPQLEEVKSRAVGVRLTKRC